MVRYPLAAIGCWCALCLAATAVEHHAAVEKKKVETPEESTRPRIELAILLDTSGSMSGLINQARTQLWTIVNEFEGVRRGGQRADVFVALYEYGNSGLESQDGYMRQVLPLTSDLDRVSEELFSLTTNGGSEHCGQVIDRAVRDLAWSSAGGDLKSIFIAGNEPFTQGPIDYHDACRAAAGRGITVSTIHCGDEQTGINTGWADGAKLADGSYMNIDHNQAVAQIDTPQDAELARLSTSLNTTYLPFGSAEHRREASQRQLAQDQNAAKLSAPVAAARALTKASGNYKNSHWDLVDALETQKVNLSELADGELPEALRGLTLAEKQAYVATKRQQRAEVQKQIKELNRQRQAYLAIERAKPSEAEGETLDSAIVEAVRTQATQKQFQFVRPDAQ